MPDWFCIRNEAQVASPALLVYPERIAANLRRLIELCGGPHRVRPHVKTHKMPPVIRIKRGLGITKFKVATIAEAEMTATAGGEDVLVAYQPVGPNIERLMRLCVSFPGTRFSSLVDNHDSLQQIAAAARADRVVMPLYLDVDVGMHRTGIAPGDAALELYRSLCETPGVVPAGLHGYDGHIHHESDAQLQRDVDSSTAALDQLRDRILAAGLPVPRIVTAGTPTAALHARRPDVEIGAGTVALWDFGQQSLSPEMGFQHAAVLLARVISRPTADRVCVDLGHKAVASEVPPPRVRFFGWEEARPVTHSEEHLVLEIGADQTLPVGSVLYGIPQHICPTVALHQAAWAVRDGWATEHWPITARDRRLTV
jgi:D-serine deaminase-like pyridoxal phosphate-dependent protein